MGPSTSRSAACTMWVPECAWRAPSAPLRVDLRCSSRPGGELAVDDPHLVHDQPAHRALHVEDLEPAAVGELDGAGVGELAAGLGVERRAVEHQLDRSSPSGSAVEPAPPPVSSASADCDSVSSVS